MPIYEYRRKDGTTFEVIQKFSDDALTTDPETGDPVERVYSAPAIHFKGSGFHNTDYGSRRRPKSGSDGDSSSGGGDSSASDGGSDSGGKSSSGSSSGVGESKKSDSGSSDSSSSSGSETASKPSAPSSSD